MATKPKPTGLDWLTAIDARRAFDLTERGLRDLREHKRVRTRSNSPKSYLYHRADLEAATGKRPKITKLCAAGARLYCGERWGIDVSPQWIERNREAGRIRCEPFGKADHLHDVADLDKLCAAPEVDDRGAYGDENGTWVIAPAAARRCKSNEETLSKYAADRAVHPLLKRRLKAQDRLVQLRHANGHWFRKCVRAYAAADVEQIEATVNAANQAKADLAVRDAGSTDDDWPTHWPTAPELKARWGWTNLSRDRKAFSLLDGKELRSREQLRGRIARGTRKMRVFDPALCKQARRNQLAGDPVGKVRVVDVANELGMHRAIVHGWKGKYHEGIGGKLTYTEHRAKVPNGSLRKIKFMTKGDRDKLLAYFKPAADKSAGTTALEAEVYPFAELASRFDLPLHWFYEGCREPGRGLDHTIEPTIKLESMRDEKKTRRWKHRRRKALKCAPLADAVAMARWAAARDGKPHGLTLHPRDDGPSAAADRVAHAPLADHVGKTPTADHGLTVDQQSKRGPGRPKGAKNRKRKYEQAADEARVVEWHASKERSTEAFDRKRGYPIGSTRSAIDRDRARGQNARKKIPA